MARSKINAPNIDQSSNDYLEGRIKDNTGSGNGTPVNEYIYGDLHQTFAKLMNSYAINYNGLPDNETNGYQLIEGLKALASKNDYIYELSSQPVIIGQTPTLFVFLKLGKLKVGESFRLIATTNFNNQSLIRGFDNISKSLSVEGNFEIGDHLIMTVESSSIKIVQDVNAININEVVTALNFLKAANQSQENVGLTNTVATTPITNLTAFIRRVIGNDSVNYLASSIRNGLYPQSHFNIVENIGTPKLQNVGFISGLDVDGASQGSSLSKGGDVTTATVTSTSGNGTQMRIHLANNMNGTNYYVRHFIQSLSGNMQSDRALYNPVFKPIDNNTFDFSIAEGVGAQQNIKIHFEVVNL